MGLLLQALDRILPDPKPGVVFEVGDRSVLGAVRGTTGPVRRAERSLGKTAQAAEGPSWHERLQSAVTDLLAELEPLSSPYTAVLLPDSATRLALFEFDSLPRRSQELRDLVEERFRSSLPLDDRYSRIALRPQRGSTPPSVLATSASATYLRSCERAFEGAGLMPVYVGPASAAAINLLGNSDSTLLVKLAMESMTMVLARDGAIKLVRRIAMPSGHEGEGGAIREALADVYPTLVYIEENLRATVSQVRVAAPHEMLVPALAILERDLGIPVRALADGDGATSACDAGLLGYLRA